MNATACSSCKGAFDFHEYATCERCKHSFHIGCVKYDDSVWFNSWRCEGCRTEGRAKSTKPLRHKASPEREELSRRARRVSPVQRQLELREALEKLDKQSGELRDTRSKNNALHEPLLQAEQKHSNVQLQSRRYIQQLAAVHEEIVGEVEEEMYRLRKENELLQAQHEALLASYDKKIADAERDAKETIGRLGRANAQLTNQLHQLMTCQAKPTTSAGLGAATSEKVANESPRTANVKPMPVPTSQQAATATLRRVSETPLPPPLPLPLPPPAQQTAQPPPPHRAPPHRAPPQPPPLQPPTPPAPLPQLKDTETLSFTGDVFAVYCAAHCVVGDAVCKCTTDDGRLPLNSDSEDYNAPKK
ncbi:protein enabled homolog [Anopheles cruzii]|uniref:protein enabled homolog n=1 Tax=Anopheles cruzii TaxID=68878 RepID=UPI0022EC68AB|nr:protein enabled homolog [Anopheles cruzii]